MGSSTPYPRPGRWRGLHRARRHTVRITACDNGNLSNACIAYSEHVGKKRQPGGSSGDIFALYKRNKETATSELLLELLENTMLGATYGRVNRVGALPRHGATSNRNAALTNPAESLTRMRVMIYFR